MPSESNGALVLDGSAFLPNSKSIKELSFDSRLKVWELLEVINEFVPEANAADYGKSWILRIVGTGDKLENLSHFAREKGLLEEEARSIMHIGLVPNTTMRIEKVRSKNA